MEQIRRKSLLYRSGLGFWCVNHVQGCAHGCRRLVHQDILPLLESVAFVDELYFGGWNYSSLPGDSADCDAFYRSEGRAVRAFCRAHRIEAILDC